MFIIQLRVPHISILRHLAPDLHVLGPLSIENVPPLAPAEFHPLLLLHIELIVLGIQCAPEILDGTIGVYHVPSLGAVRPFAGLQDHEERVETREDFGDGVLKKCSWGQGSGGVWVEVVELIWVIL